MTTTQATIIRSKAAKSRFPREFTPYMRRMAKEYLGTYDTCTRVTFFDGSKDRRGLESTLKPGELAHCMSGPGKWGKPKKIYYGKRVLAEKLQLDERWKQVQKEARKREQERKKRQLQDAIPIELRDRFQIVKGFCRYYLALRFTLPSGRKRDAVVFNAAEVKRLAEYYQHKAIPVK